MASAPGFPGTAFMLFSCSVTGSQESLWAKLVSGRATPKHTTRTRWRNERILYTSKKMAVTTRSGGGERRIYNKRKLLARVTFKDMAAFALNIVPRMISTVLSVLAIPYVKARFYGR